MLPIVICAYSTLLLIFSADPQLCQANTNGIYFIVILQITSAKKNISFVKSASTS
jgi:hypothetical protein